MFVGCEDEINCEGRTWLCRIAAVGFKCKPSGMIWTEHVACMNGINSTYETLIGMSGGSDEDNIKMHVTVIG
jgi:hypothetical protein